VALWLKYSDFGRMQAPNEAFPSSNNPTTSLHS